MELKKLLIGIILVIMFVTFTPYFVASPVFQESKDEDGFYNIWFGAPFPFMQQTLPIGPLPEGKIHYVRARLRMKVTDSIASNYLTSIVVILFPLILTYFIVNKCIDKN